MSFQHNCGVYHRDLKTENILMDKDKTVRVADFGISTCERGLLTQHCGSPAYCPPEIFKKIPYLAAPMDVWALGLGIRFAVVVKGRLNLSSAGAGSNYESYK